MYLVSLLVLAVMATGNAENPGIDVSLRLSDQEILCGQNLVGTLTLRNSSGRDLVLRGFRTTFALPAIECRLNNGEWRELGRANTGKSDLTRSPIPVMARQEISFTFLMFAVPGTALRTAGTYQLRATLPAVCEIDPDTRNYLREVSWRTSVTQLAVKTPTGRDQEAYNALTSRIDSWRKSSRTDRETLRNGYRAFLEKHPDSAYSPEIRLQLAGELRELSSGTPDSPDRRARAKERIDLLEEVTRSASPLATVAFPVLVDMYTRDRDVMDSAAAVSAVDRWLKLCPNDSAALAARDRVSRRGRDHNRPTTSAPAAWNQEQTKTSSGYRGPE